VNLSELAARHASSVRRSAIGARAAAGSVAGVAEAARAIRDGGGTRAGWRQQVMACRGVPGFFPTPPELAERLVDAAGIQPGWRVLEPSAGSGNLVGAILGRGAYCVAIEVNVRLSAMIGARFCNGLSCSLNCADFMTWDGGPFDAVVMNPPFERRQDEAHLRRAISMLRPGGRLACIVSRTTGDRLRGEFNIENLPDDSFAKSENPTHVRTCLVTN